MNLNPLTLKRRRAYIKTFDNPEGRKVLADLRRFVVRHCRRLMSITYIRRICWKVEGKCFCGFRHI
jgi:hypothetical protein